MADRLRYLAQGAAMQLSSMDARLRRRLGIAPEALHGVELPERPPDSRLAREAEELCRELSTPALLNHCLRVYVWGSLLGARDRLRYDDELLFVASLLHDLGLTDSFASRDGPPCFAVQGAIAAGDWGLKHGCERSRAEVVANAISLHINPRVPPSEGVEAHLLAAGAAFDVIGARYGHLAKPLVAAAVELHPRLGFKREMEDRSRRAAHRGPQTRVAFGYRLGFGRMIAGAPFAD
ncbi:MAG TPA: HD domain-containing protein [Thermoleophilaceae bacterium]|nr:HD domain-containing protein [Thermoleophilaceae bacterium]